MKLKSLGATLLLASCATMGVVGSSGAAVAATNETARRTAVTSYDGNASHQNTGTWIELTNDAWDTVTLSRGAMTYNIAPGATQNLAGASDAGDDISATMKFGDDTTKPLYGHNPGMRDAYVQVAGFKWYGNGINVVDGKKFDVCWTGTTKYDGMKYYKYWKMCYQGAV